LNVTVEQILEGEHEGWVQHMHDALAALHDAQSKNTDNQKDDQSPA